MDELIGWWKYSGCTKFDEEIKTRWNRRIFCFTLLCIFTVQAFVKTKIAKEESRVRGSSQDLEQHRLCLENRIKSEENK